MNRTKNRARMRIQVMLIGQFKSVPSEEVVTRIGTDLNSPFLVNVYRDMQKQHGLRLNYCGWHPKSVEIDATSHFIRPKSVIK